MNRALLSIAAGILALLTSCAPKDPAYGRKVTLPYGTFTIDSVEIGDRLPGCPPGASCPTAKPGFQMVTVWLQGKGNGEFMNHLKDVHLQSGDGAETIASVGGTMKERPFVAFTPAEGAKNFVLYWGSNPPIPLGR